MYSIVSIIRVVTVVLSYCWLLPSFAAVLNVPDDYTSIQGALDSTADGDTVQLAPGVYHEFLIGPGHKFTLSGEYAPDSLNDSLWSVLDPIPPLEGDTASSFVASGDSVILINFAIMNRPEMREPVWPTRTGGIEYSGPFLSLTNCRFDSVSRAIQGGEEVILDSCRFIGCLWWCVHPNNFGSVQAQHCNFDGQGFWLARSYSNSSYIHCTFTNWPLHGYLLSFYGENILVSGCKFGPGSQMTSPLTGYTQGNCRVENCDFIGISQAPSLLRVDMDCPGPDSLPIVISNNVFRDFFVVSQHGIPAIELMCQDPQAGYFGSITNNVITYGRGTFSTGVNAHGSAYIENNIFDSLSSGDYANVRGARTSGDSLIVRFNQFLGGGFAAQTDGMTFDARWNWWGDSSGPYNASENPNGLGSEVGWGVEFMPWLLQPDDSTVDTNEVAIERPEQPFVSTYSLSVYPNPFNATTTLEIEVARAGEYDVVLYDVTGREVGRVFHGRIDAHATVRIDASAFASGVYFVKLSGDERMLAAEKLLLLK